MKMLSAYRPRFVKTIVYMLQMSDYRIWLYLKWLWRTEDFRTVEQRGTLVLTKVSRLMYVAAWLIVLMLLTVAGYLATYYTFEVEDTILAFAGVFMLFALPFLLAHLMLIPTFLGDVFIIRPLRARQNAIARKIFANHKGTKIAVAGSFGKTTMKEILASVLSEGKKVAYTQGNFNVDVAHYRFAKTLKGDEDILIIEFGEYRPGDVAGFCKVVDPDIGVITGLNEAHLENFGTIEASAKNILALADHVGLKNLYINGESERLLMFAPNEAMAYTYKGMDDWAIDKIHINAMSLSFRLKKDKKTYNLNSSLIGRHNVGPLSGAAIIADRFKLTKKQIEEGIRKTTAFEHRLQPSKQGDVIVIDDTYNGNIDGVRVGVNLLHSIKANRKVYITPGLVELGNMNERIHNEIGELVATVADIVILFENSTTPYIKKGLKDGLYKGELVVVKDPLKFYKNLNNITASGDVVLMQNDWTDNYA